MDFYELVDKVVDLLRRRGRATYSSLKIQFQLDDAQLGALREEILYAHESAVEVDDRGFVWTGETEQIPVTPSQPDQLEPEPQPVVEPTQPVQSPETERRQLTVMFCDLVGSTSLSGVLDPEYFRDVVRAYHSVCTDVITRYNGHVAQAFG